MMDEVYYDADEEVFLLRRLKNCPEIFAAIAESSNAALSSQRKLRNEFDDDLVRAALSVHEARQRAAGFAATCGTAVVDSRRTGAIYRVGRGSS